MGAQRNVAKRFWGAKRRVADSLTRRACLPLSCLRVAPISLLPNVSSFWKKGKDPHPQDKIQHLVFSKDPRPLYYKTPPCAFYHKMSVVRPFSVLSKDEIGP